MRASLQLDQSTEALRSSAVGLTNLSETQLLVGQVAEAQATAESSIATADRAGEPGRMMTARATLGDALHAGGRLKEAAVLFAEAERLQQQSSNFRC
jgi:hypothetical protein